jgi:hypothetical protein
MDRAQIVEVVGMAFIALLVAAGGKQLLFVLSEHKVVGAIIGAGLVIAAFGVLRRAYDPADPDARLNVTKAGAYFCAATLALWAIVAPARWNYGAFIVAAEAALVFDIITVAARKRVAGGQ